MSDRAAQLWAMVEQYVAAEGIELDDLEVVGSGAGTIVRVTVDSDRSVDIDHIAALSRGLSRLLDAQDPISGSYTLEVSSPGLERKLRRPAHYAKSVGRDVKVKVKGDAGFETLRGRITTVDASSFELETAEGLRRVSFDDVTSASTVFTWEKSPKPGSREGR